MKKAFTLIELTITVIMFVVVAAVTSYVFRVILLSWSAQETRAGINIDINMGIEEMRCNLMQAKDVDDSVNDDELRFTTLDDTYHIYYFYNASDSYPPDFEEGTYEIKMADLAGVAGGDLTTGSLSYGAGRPVIFDILPPATSDLSFDTDTVTIDLSSNQNDETIRLRTQVRPRNLGL